MVTDTSITDLTNKVAVKQAVARAVAIDSGVGLNSADGDAQQMTSNTDRTITVYSTLNGEPKFVLAIDAERVLAKKRSDGKLAHWIPGLPGSAPEYVKGVVKCILHPEFEEPFPFDVIDPGGPQKIDRAWIESIGLAGRTCNMMAPDKPNRGDFPSAYSRDEHGQKRHRREWATYKDALLTVQQRQQTYRERMEAEERRKDREAMMALVQSRVAAPEPVVEPKPEKGHGCPQCDFASASEHGLNIHMAKHSKE